MKKIGILIVVISSFLLSCSSEEDTKNVCACEDLYAKMRLQETTFQLEHKMSSKDAKDKTMLEYKGEFNKCAKLQADLGEDTYFKLSQTCGSK